LGRIKNFTLKNEVGILVTNNFDLKP
jgi:hypothetical protein